MILLITLSAALLMLGAAFLAHWAASMRGLRGARGQLARRGRQLEELSVRLQGNNRELAKLNRMKSKFLSMAVHEVRTPLASIHGFGEILRRQSPDARRAEYARNVMRGAEQIRRLMEDLTNLAVIEAGKLRMEKARFELASLLEDVVGPFELEARRRGVYFSAHAPARGVSMVADRLRLAQVLFNFLNNAMKFTPQGGRVALKVAADARAALFRVEDTGPGIHASERERIFEKFYQSRFSARSDQKKGWGLGLAIAQEIVQAHGGRIGAESAGLGKGAVFWFRIPLAALLFACAAAGPCRAQGLPMEEKIQLEHSIERKAESLLTRLWGPDRARVVANATLDFTRVERFEVKNAQEAAEPQGAPNSEWLPGIPLSESPGFGEVKSYERRALGPESLIKRLSITVVLDKKVGVREADEAAHLLADALDLQPARGDTLSMTRAPFASAWMKFWRNPGAVGSLAKYVLAMLFCLAALAAVAFCLLKIADAMRAMAEVREPMAEQPLEASPPAPASSALVFDVRPERADALLELLRDQDPDNIAFVVAHLPQPTQEAFLGKLPEAMRSQVLSSLKAPVLAEAGLVAQVKDELERRVNGAGVSIP